MSPGAPLSLSLIRSHYRDPPIPERSETRNDILPSLAVKALLSEQGTAVWF